MEYLKRKSLKLYISILSTISTISTLPSLAVCGLLHHYLASLQLTSDIVFGVLRWDEAARAGPEDFEGTPHVWLRVATDTGVGVPIDNNYVAFPPNADNIEVDIIYLYIFGFVFKYFWFNINLLKYCWFYVKIFLFQC